MMNKNFLDMIRQIQSIKSVNTKCETYGGPYSFTECPAVDGYTQEAAYATTGNHNSGGNSYQPQGDRNMHIYYSNNYLEPPDFNQPNVQNNQNRQNQNQRYNQNRGNNLNQGNYQVPNNQVQVQPSNELSNYMKINETNMRAMQNQITTMRIEIKKDFETTMEKQLNELKNMMSIFLQMQSPSSLRSLPSNTIANPKGDVKAITTRSGVAYDGTTIAPTLSPLSKVVERETNVTKDKVQTIRSESTAHVQPLVIEVPTLEPDVALKPNPKPSIPYLSRLSDQKLCEKTNNQMLNTPLNENYLAVLLKKLPEKLKDHGKFLIPCDFSEQGECLALADLGASINLMPLSIWKKLSLSELTPTCMTLKLINRSVAYLVVERETNVTKDKVQTIRSESTTHVQPLVIQVLTLEPDVALKPNPKPFAYSLLHMPKFSSTFKSLLSNKEKLFKLASTPLNENYLAVLLKKLPEKLKDHGKFLIRCDFSELGECLALADLGASINLMPLSIWKKLSLSELTPTCMTLKLINRSVAYLVSVAEDVFVKVKKIYFPTNFVVVDYDVDPRDPLILERPFLRIARALIDVHGEEESFNRIDVIDVSCEEYAQEVLRFSDSSTSGNPTPSDPIIASSSLSFTPFKGSDFILEEIENFLRTPDELSTLNDDFDPEGDITLIVKLLNKYPLLGLNNVLISFILMMFSFGVDAVEDFKEYTLRDYYCWLKNYCCWYKLKLLDVAADTS
nr:hypothetical protein [Tanacetum cinerariifolium]